MQTIPMKTVSVLGCGWFGLAFAKKLIELGYAVKGSTTTAEKLPLLSEANIQPYLVNFTANKIAADVAFFDADVLFICIPPKRNSTELNDYPIKIQAIIDAAKNKSKNVVLISSTSIYGDDNKTVNENSATQPDTASGKVILKAEEIIQNLLPKSFTILRFAGLFGPERNPGRFFAGKTSVSNGLAPVNLIHQMDAIGIALSIIEKQAFGRVYNACAPQHPTKKEFYTDAAAKTGLEKPEFIAEKTSWKVIESENVLAFLDYKFEVNI
ncbi:SDR family oxidoreductase [Pedobacter aquatilis]|uniref:SDR family oxidoreductase n=1 Tax=Pedobacter aquatilis TaxID=351343 RepID=UPI0025B35C3C|nr:SDR family oxidoreductase [Pedobacter aquatilis]MDN3586343.1 SDR family oxidoreductase [Pedobacter aquatilis]